MLGIVKKKFRRMIMDPLKYPLLFDHQFDSFTEGIKFEKYEEITKGKLWWYEIPTTSGQCEILKIETHATLAPHRHLKSDFEVFILNGTGWVRLDGEVIQYEKGNYMRIPKSMIHGFTATSETLLYSKTAGTSEGDTEFINESYPIYQMWMKNKQFFFSLEGVKSQMQVLGLGCYVIDNLGAIPRARDGNVLDLEFNKIVRGE